MRSSSLLYQEISGFGEANSWHSKTSLLPSSSCLRAGFCVKLGAKSSDTPMVLSTGHYGRTVHARLEVVCETQFNFRPQFFFKNIGSLASSPSSKIIYKALNIDAQLVVSLMHFEKCASNLYNLIPFFLPSGKQRLKLLYTIFVY